VNDERLTEVGTENDPHTATVRRRSDRDISQVAEKFSQPSRGAIAVAISMREDSPVLPRMCDTWVWIVRRERNMRPAITGLDSPAATRSATRRSVVVRLSQPWVGRLRRPR